MQTPTPLLTLAIVSIACSSVPSTSEPPRVPGPASDAGVDSATTVDAAPPPVPDSCLDALVSPSGSALQSLNPIALAFAEELGLGAGADPLVEMAGYPSLCSGVGGNADYGVNADVFFTASTAQKWTVAAIQNVYVRPLFYVNATTRFAEYYGKAMRPDPWSLFDSNDNPDGTATVDGVKKCGCDPDHLPYLQMESMLKHPEITVTACKGKQVKAADFAAVALRYIADGEAGMLRNYFVGKPFSASIRHIAKSVMVMRAASMAGQLSESTYSAWYDWTTKTVLPYFEAGGMVTFTYPSAMNGLSPPIAANVPVAQVNEWTLLVRMWFWGADWLKTKDAATATRMLAIVERYGNFLTEVARADGAIPSMITLKQIPQSATTSILPYLADVHYSIYGSTPAYDEYRSWGYNSLRIVQSLKGSLAATAGSKADANLAWKRSHAANWGPYNSYVGDNGQGDKSDYEIPWYVEADGVTYAKLH